MTNIDQEIRKALMEGESEEIRELGHEQGLLEMSLGVFRGRNRRINISLVMASAAVFALGVYSLIRFVSTSDTREIAVYGVLLIFSFLIILGLRLWFWMEMNKNSVIREILRLELRIQEISRKLDSG